MIKLTEEERIAARRAEAATRAGPDGTTLDPDDWAAYDRLWHRLRDAMAQKAGGPVVAAAVTEGLRVILAGN